MSARFRFGKNWLDFIKTLNKEQIEHSSTSLVEMLEMNNLDGKTFLDIGCGSGLFSLAATNVNARVHSFDYDKYSVECTLKVKEKFHPYSEWKIEEGDILNRDYITSLGKFDVVYSWGVLHHTGNMYLALENACIPVKAGGKFFIAIYNDQGFKSKFWLKVKKFYNKGLVGRIVIVVPFFSYYFLSGFIYDILSLRNPLKRYKEYNKQRGMSMIHDWYDWLGGLPFEVARPEKIIEYVESQRFVLDRIITTNSLGCNQFVFKKYSNSTD